MADFKTDVLVWVRSAVDSRAAEITAVGAWGSDWEGSTEGGFYDSARIELTYRRDDGSTHYHSVSGEEMGDLWKWVINGWSEHGTA